MTTLLLYFLAIALVIIQANIPLPFAQESPKDNQAMVAFFRRFPFYGTWISNSTSNSLLSGSRGTLDLQYTTYHDTQYSSAHGESRKILRVVLFDPEFSDEANIELMIRSDQVSNSQFIGEVSGSFSALKHFGFTSAIASTLQINLVQTGGMLNDSQNDTMTSNFDINDMIFTANLYLSGDVQQSFELKFSYSGYSVACKLLLYSALCIFFIGINFYCSLEILLQLLNDDTHANLMNIYTVCLSICQNAFLFVFNIVTGLSLSNSAFLMISVLPAISLLVAIWSLMRGWIGKGFDGAEDATNSQRALQRFFFNKVLLITAGLLLIFFNMQYFLEPWTLGLNACALVPQLVQNIRTRVPAQFSLKYLIGFASSPFFVLVFLRGSAFNPIQISYSYTWPYCILAVWGLQLVAIKLQHAFHSEIILPFFLRTKSHRYFKRKSAYSLRLPNQEIDANSSEEHNLQTISSMSNLDSSSSPGSGNLCSVCQDNLMNNPPAIITTQTNASTNSKDSSLRKRYPKKIFNEYLMSTPCRHDFHSGCLLEWMQVKMACPVCRCALPPLE